MILGAALVITALSLFLYNRSEDRAAGRAAGKLAGSIRAEIQKGENETEGETAEGADSDTGSDTAAQPEMTDTAMTVCEIDGYACIGYLSIPALDLTLPVLNEWNSENLKISPCRYSGSAKTGDLILCGHNYAAHFGGLKELAGGDEVLLTDMDGRAWLYQVAEVETLAPDAVDKMMAGGYDLTLFTCTVGGSARVAVRCMLTE